VPRSHNIKFITPISLDVTDTKALDTEVRKVDLVVSLIPYTFHAAVIKSAIREKKHVVTTSYVSPAMMELDADAKAAGITVMNEIGLDPGIDHLYAVKTIDEVHKAGGKIITFLSYCGGLPAPEASNNPLGYKFFLVLQRCSACTTKYSEVLQGWQGGRNPWTRAYGVSKAIFYLSRIRVRGCNTSLKSSGQTAGRRQGHLHYANTETLRATRRWPDQSHFPVVWPSSRSLMVRFQKRGYWHP